METLSKYPDPSARELKDEICAFWSRQARLCPDNIKVANGSMVVLARLVKMLVDSGVSVLGYVPQFKDWMEEVTVMGGNYEAVALDPAEDCRCRCKTDPLAPVEN
jgi:histidinol-phosphate aminotransferase